MVEKSRLFSNILALYLVDDLKITRGNIRLIIEAAINFCMQKRTNIFTVKDIIENAIPALKRSTIINYMPDLKSIGLFDEKSTSSRTGIYRLNFNAASIKGRIEADFPQFRAPLREFVEDVYVGA
ncbi:hypothetical protein KY358_04220 [Candidatus Woesearchaeota archaeon]|nr:hypothetical protein [Candidatus Woesearchaeota archaeon]